MTDPRDETLDFILQRDVTDGLLSSFGTQAWQVLYRRGDKPPHRLGIWCALLDDSSAVRALDHDGWDLLIGDGRPGFSQSYAQGRTVTTYERQSGGGVRPLLHYRSFHGAFQEYIEVDEEFRLYHDLAEDKTRDILLAFDSSGREIDVVKLLPGEVLARLKYLREFQAGTRLHLGIFVDSVRYSGFRLDDIPEDQRRASHIGARTRWLRTVARCDFRDDYEVFSRVLCKAILPPPPVEQAGIWPFESSDDGKVVSFVIGVDQDGRPLEHSSEPDQLSNYFGANPGAPHYLTPVFFRREVLAKYFSEPERYSVEDGSLSCLHLWSCRIDNDLGAHVAVFLGDLGRDLPYEERLHWRQFNVPPEGTMSETNVRRSFLGQFAAPSSADLVFRRTYAECSKDWLTAAGWPLFLPLSSGDAHLLETVRIPVTNSQRELDEQIGNLAKLMVDSLNEKALEASSAALPQGSKGISKLDAFLLAAGHPEREPIIQFLRDLQTLRSTGSAHRKGSAYEKIIAKLGIEPARRPDAVRRLLEEASALLKSLSVAKPTV